MSTQTSQSKAAALLPLAVHIGFAGARRLMPEMAHVEGAARTAFESAVTRQLQAALAELPGRLGLDGRHFIVGISQMAAGADLLFSECAEKLGWGQRVFLPQQRDAFLAAQGSEGPDFGAMDADRARRLLQSDHVIEELVATTAATRAERFHDTNVAILAEADALVCLRVAHRVGKVGGTQALIKRAIALGKAVLELVLQVGPDGAPTLQATFHEARDEGQQPRSVAPTLPELAPALAPGVPLGVSATGPANWPGIQEYAEALKSAGSAGSRQRQALFRNAAGVVVGSHASATLLAVLAMTAVADGPGWLLVGVLVAEVALLLWGYLTHHRLHHGRHAEQWAMARLCAEVARSVLAYGKLPGTLRYLLALPMPESMRPLLRTLIVLHLRAVQRSAGNEYRQEVQAYLHRRLTNPDPRIGQIAYYEGKQREAKRHAEWAGYAFATMSMLAMAATVAKLALKLPGAPMVDGLGEGLAIAGVMLPVMAVGVLSFTAALDMEARSHTFAQMHEFVKRQAQRMEGVGSPGEAAASAAETESRLLGETVTWYSRRAYTNIA